MMTSNFARYNIEKFPNAVSISRSSRWFKGRRYPRLAPSRDLLTKYLAGVIIWTNSIRAKWRMSLVPKPCYCAGKPQADFVIGDWLRPGWKRHWESIMENIRLYPTILMLNL